MDALKYYTYLSNCSSLALQRDFTKTESAGRWEEWGRGLVQGGQVFEEKEYVVAQQG